MSTHEYPHPFDFQGSIKLGQTAVEKRRHQVNKGPDSLSVLWPPPLSISAFLVIITLGPIFHNISKLKRVSNVHSTFRRPHSTSTTDTNI